MLKSNVNGFFKKVGEKIKLYAKRLKDLINRLKNLVILQIGDKFVIKDKSKMVMPFLFKVVGFCLIGAITFLLFMVMERFIFLKPTTSMILLIIFVSQVITLVANATELTNALYGSKDNAILLSMPAKHSEIFISKLIVFYIIELISNVMFLLPILLGFGLYTKQSVWFLLFSVITSVVLPIISVLIGALISIPLSLINKVLKKVSVLYVFLFAGLLFVLFYFAVGIVEEIPNPLRFLALYDYIVKLIYDFINSANRYSLFYEWFLNVLLKIGVFKNILYILILTVGLIVLNVLSSWPLFFKLASNSSETAVIKKHKGVNKEAKTTFGAFYKKELLISLRTFGNVLKNYSLVIFMPLFLYLINGLFNAFDLNSLGKSIIFGFNILVGLMILITSNSASATALSEEGSEFILLKTSPVDTKMIAWAKILNNALVSVVLIIISMIILQSMHVFNTVEMIYILFTYIVVDFGHMIWSFQFDLRNPQIKDMALTGNISNKKNVVNSLTSGVVVSLIFGLLAILFSVTSLMAIYVIIVILFAVWRFVVFDGNLKSYFYDIEL